MNRFAVGRVRKLRRHRFGVRDVAALMGVTVHEVREALKTPDQRRADAARREARANRKLVRQRDRYAERELHVLAEQLTQELFPVEPGGCARRAERFSA